MFAARSGSVMLSRKNTPRPFLCPRKFSSAFMEIKTVLKKNMQFSFHCLRQESLWQRSKITKRHRHHEAPERPLPEQQPKPYWESSGGNRLTVVGKGGELWLPHTSTQDFRFTSRYLCCQVQPLLQPPDGPLLSMSAPNVQCTGQTDKREEM